MADSAHPFVFICGADDFLVGRAGRERFDAMVAETGADDFSREVISGFSANVGEVEASLQRFRESVQTVPMFGGTRVVWFKDVNFLADSVTGRAESTLALVDDLQALLGALNPAETRVLVTAAPIDRRRAFPKWCEKTAEFQLVGGDADAAGEALAGVALAEAKKYGVRFADNALELLLARVGANTRLLVEEIHKLATYVEEKGTIQEAQVDELTPNVAEGDFFEVADTFFRGDLPRTIDALHRHFFAGESARPLLSALQNRNRLLIQVRALVDGGDVRLGPRGLDGLQKAAAYYGGHFGVAVGEKSNCNVFTQNAWYLGKLANTGPLPPLRRLIDWQKEFLTAFAELIRRPQEEEAVMRDMAVRCLSKPA